MTKEEDDMRVALVENELKASLEKNHTLERENEQLKQELACLKSQMAVIKSQNADRRSNLWKNLGTITSTDNNASQHKHIKQNNGSATEIPAAEDSSQKTDYSDVTDRKDRKPRIPKPPPKPTSNYVTPMLVTNENASQPPPPPPLKLKRDSPNAVVRVQEVVELYRTLTRRDAKLDMKSGNQADLLPINGREMIGEIENRSAYLLAIKSDVETQGEFIRFLMKEVQNAAYKEIADVEAFVKWLDNELSYLVDERAVLKHFLEWPERKADAMREAAFGYRDLKNLESEVLSFHDDPKQPTPFALKRIQTLQDKLEHSVHNLERMREGSIMKYKEFQIPCEWMLNTGLIAQLKLGSMKLAKQYMRRVTTELESSTLSEENDLILRGVRFAFRVHQFVGGFDAESRYAFQELKRVSSGYCA